MKRIKRMKDLDIFDLDTGLVTQKACKNLQTGQIEYFCDQETYQNGLKIDEHNGRQRIAFLDDMFVYAKKDDKENKKIVGFKIDEILYYLEKANDAIQWLIKNNEECGHIDKRQIIIKLKKVK